MHDVLWSVWAFGFTEKLCTQLFPLDHAPIIRHVYQYGPRTNASSIWFEFEGAMFFARTTIRGLFKSWYSKLFIYVCTKWTNKEYFLPKCAGLIIQNLEKYKWYSRKNYMIFIAIFFFFFFWCCEAHRGRLVIIIKLTLSVQPTCYYFCLKIYIVYLRNVARGRKKQEGK
jgi:hypothetical protein